MGGVLIWVEATAASMYLSIVSLDTRALARSNLPSTRMSQDGSPSQPWVSWIGALWGCRRPISAKESDHVVLGRSLVCDGPDFPAAHLKGILYMQPPLLNIMKYL